MARKRNEQDLQFPSTSNQVYTDPDVPNISTMLLDPFTEKPTGIIISVHEGFIKGKIECVSVSLIYESNSGPTVYSKKMNCTQYSQEKFNNLQIKECGIGTTFYCPKTHHEKDNPTVIHNGILIAGYGIRDVEVIFPIEAQPCRSSCTQTNTNLDESGTSLQSEPSSYDLGSSKAQQNSHTSGDSMGDRYYTRPGIIFITVSENKKGSTDEIRIELQPPELKLKSDSDQTSNTEEQQDDISELGESEIYTNQTDSSNKENTYRTPPYMIKYNNIKYRESYTITQMAFASTHPELFIYDLDEYLPLKNPVKAFIQSSFSIQLNYIRCVSKRPEVRTTSTTIRHTKLHSFTTTKQEPCPIPEEPDFQKWIMNFNKYLRTRLLTDLSGIRGVYVNYNNVADEILRRPYAN